MRDNNTTKVKKEFFKITKVFPSRRINYLQDNVIRKDRIFDSLAEKVFDYPNLLNTLLFKIKKWLNMSKEEFTYSLAGYIYYLNEDFDKAKSYFLKAIEKNPENLDNWLDLAFSLYHLGKREEKLAKSILFNFDLFIQFYSKCHFKKCTLKVVKKLESVIMKNLC